MTTHLDHELSAWLDGELSGVERARVETHLAECAACRELLDDLAGLVERAGTLADAPPARDLWSGIAERIGAPGAPGVVPLHRPGRRFSFTMPQLAAAAVALMAFSAGSAALLNRGTPVVAPARMPAITAAPAAMAIDRAVASYDAAIADLETTLAARRGSLDSATVRVVTQSLDVIDAAIRQAREALDRDPNSRFLNQHLQRALDRKLHVLRQVATLPVS